ncbi:MAG TPA: hypothetical protein DIT99_09810 [Candidatus Latescibacteria bacterium]|nr:hypothetical protein [Candidatus Latescibacterota bacterium]
MQTIGSSTSRLSIKENTLGVAINNTKAALSRIRDADPCHGAIGVDEGTNSPADRAIFTVAVELESTIAPFTLQVVQVHIERNTWKFNPPGPANRGDFFIEDHD